MTSRLVKVLPRQTYNSAVKACAALVESERLRRMAGAYREKNMTQLADAKHTEVLAHAKKVIAAREGK